MHTGFNKDASRVLKGLACLLMVGNHLLSASEGSHTLVYFFVSTDFMLRAAGMFGICLGMFVIISCYGMATKLMEVDRKCEEEKVSGVVSQKHPYEKLMFERLKVIMAGSFWVYITMLALFSWKFNFYEIYQTTSMKNLSFFMLMDALGLAQFTNPGWINGTWWYLGLAVELIFVIPLLYMLYKKIGNVMLPFAVMVSMTHLISDEVLEVFLPTAAIGICAACGDWFGLLQEKIKGKQKQYFTGLLAIAGMIFLTKYTYVFFNGTYSAASPVSMAVIAFLAAYASISVLSRTPVVKQVLSVVGKHSMNIYLVHAFFFDLVFPEYYWGLHYGEIMMVAVVLTGIVYSIILEQGKQWFRKAGKSFSRG